PCVPAGARALALVLLWARWRVLDGAPLAELSGDQDFQLFLHKNLEFTRKIRGDVAVLQRAVCDTFQLCTEDELLLVQQDLGLVLVPLEQCHGRTFQAVTPRAHSSSAGAAGMLPRSRGISGAGADITAFPRLQMEDLGLATVTFPAEDQGPLPTFSSRFQQQVGGFFILANFQRFLETAYRALRHLARL
ncbi:MGF factor, partial [Syrrhaptes paradoxus]|nr:MGF factor [Syrrhaptes paradoxus]